jgi:FkbM family methyltransferase
MNNALKLAIAPKRWIKKYFRNYLPEMAYLDTEFSRIFFSLRDVSGPSFDLAYGGKNSFERYESRDKVLLGKYIKDGDVFLDIGANIGHFSFYFNGKFKDLKCHMFEPHPVLSKCVNETKSYNKLDNVVVHQVALSNENSELEFFEDSFNDGGHSLISENVSKRSAHNSFKVQAVTLDEYVSELNTDKIDVVKIDVQGAEFMLLEGAKRTFKDHAPKIFVELENVRVLEFWKKLEEACEIEFEVISPYLDKVLKKNEIDEFFEKDLNFGSSECNWLFIPKK